MSLEMGDSGDYSGLQEVANAIRDDTGMMEGPGSLIAQKRKRGSSVHDGSADDGRRTSAKRVSPNSSNNAGNGNENTDPSFMDNQQDADVGVESLQDYNALHQQNTSENQNGSADHSNATSTAAAALGMYPTMTIPQPTDVSFASQATEGDRNQDSFNMDNSQHGDSFMESTPGNAQSSGGRGSGSQKPAVGTEEWHKVRKDNHKEVERRRRETINEGINELAKIVPGCEKNKGSILQRAVSFITQLKENEAQNIEKWTLEKLLTEQAIAELSASNDKLKTECERAWREVETWKRTCQSAGLAPKKEDGSSEN